MLAELKIVNEKFISVLKKTEGILAAWYFGSNKHGLSDEYSDIDIVLLASETDYPQIDKNLIEIFKGICDDVILCWGEDFNGDAMKNYDFLLRLNGEIFQYDVFLLNHSHIDDYMCKLHYTDLSRKDIIFAQGDEADMLIQKSPKGTVWQEDIKRIIETYWLHVQMSVKYFKRRDFFKLNSVLRILMDMHTSLLLNTYDRITWGGSANKLHFIPEEKQAHLMKYGCIEDFDLMKKNLWLSINWFENDVIDGVGSHFDIEDNNNLVACIKEYWIKHMHDS